MLFVFLISRIKLSIITLQSVFYVIIANTDLSVILQQGFVNAYYFTFFNTFISCLVLLIIHHLQHLLKLFTVSCFGLSS